MTIADCWQQWAAYDYWQQYETTETFRNYPWVAYNDNDCWQCYTSMQQKGLAPIATTRSTDDEDDILRLRDMKEKKKQLVSDQLEVALSLSKDADRELKKWIERVKLLAKPRHIEDATLGDVKDALRYAEKAVGMSLERAPELHYDLDLLAKNIRDMFTLRVQLVAGPVHDKQAYLKVLKQVYGHSLGDEEKSRLMISHKNIIWEEFPNAFNSNNKLENLNRGGKRGRRERIPKKRRSISAPPPLELQDVQIVGGPPGLENVTVKSIDENVKNIDDTVKNIHETVTISRARPGVANKMSRTFEF